MAPEFENYLRKPTGPLGAVKELRLMMEAIHGICIHMYLYAYTYIFLYIRIYLYT